MCGDGAVQRVEERCGNTGEDASSEARERHRLQELRQPVSVAGNGSVAECKPPGRVPLVLAESVQERYGSEVAQREECELLVAVDEDNDTRRPGTETSTSVVEQDRPSKLRPQLLLREVGGGGAAGRREDTEQGQLPIAARVFDDMHLARAQAKCRACFECLFGVATQNTAGAFRNPHDLVVEVVVPRRPAGWEVADEQRRPRRAVVWPEEHPKAARAGRLGRARGTDVDDDLARAEWRMAVCLRSDGRLQDDELPGARFEPRVLAGEDERS